MKTKVTVLNNKVCATRNDRPKSFTEWKDQITVAVEGLYYAFFNVPTKKPHIVCVSDTPDGVGSCYGKLVIEGKTWREVYESLIKMDLSKEAFAKRKNHEIPDNRS
jgi:hypothetical protein